MPAEGGPGWLGRFLAQVERAPDAPAVQVLGEPARSYAELLAAAERVRAALEEDGLVAGEAVALFLPSGRELIEAFWATSSLAAVAAPLSPTLTAYELPPLLDVLTPAVVLTTRALLPRLAPLLGGRRLLRSVRLVDVDGAADDAPDVHGVTVRGLGAARSPLEEPPAAAVIGCHFTYKGLGYALGAEHRAASYSLVAAALAERFPPVDRDPNLVLLPFHQVYGLVSSVIAPLTTGCPLLLTRRLSPQRLLSIIAREKVRYACLVPPLFPFLVAAARADRALREALRPDLCLLSGGSLLDAAAAAQVADAVGVEPYQGYGLTETLPIVANTPQDNVPGALGRALFPGLRLSIRDAGGQEVPTGVAGEVHVAGPSLTTGYRRRPRETARFLRDGWLRTGDLGHLDADGRLHFLGRREAFTKVGGQMVDLLEVEAVLQEHRAVADACVFSARGRGGQPELRAAVVLAGKSGVRLGELLALARERLSPHKVPRRIKIYRSQVQRLEAEF